MATALAEGILSALLPEWHQLLQGWAADGSLVAAAQEALMLQGEPPALRDLVTRWAAGDFTGIPPIVLLSSANMNGAMGAYAISTGTIYLNADWLAGAGKEAVNAVLTEELGHHLDGLLNAADTPGDEGEYFADLLNRETITAERAAEIGNQIDVGSVVLADHSIGVEKAVLVSGPTIPGAISTYRTGQEYTNSHAFAALRANGSVITWGNPLYGGDSRDVSGLLSSGVTQVFSSTSAFAALRIDGSVITWGDRLAGGDSTRERAKLASGVTQIYSSAGAFAALKENGSVVTWGHPHYGSDSSEVAEKISSGVVRITSSHDAFAALKADGSVVCWGGYGYLRYSPSSSALLSSGVAQIFSNNGGFAAIKTDGSVISWRSNVEPSIINAFKTSAKQIYSTYNAFAVLETDGSVYTTWPLGLGGVAEQLSSGVSEIVSSLGAFAAIKTDGSVVTWGDTLYGSDSTSVAGELSSGVTRIFSTPSAFAALKADGSVVTWGNPLYGGNSSSVSGRLNSGVSKIFSTSGAFAALKTDGSLVTWGSNEYGANSLGIAGQLSPGVANIFNSAGAFAALTTEGTVVTWGGETSGGNSSSVAVQLNNVVDMANPFTDNRLVTDLPANVFLASNGVPENSSPGTLIGTLSVADAIPGTTYSYSIVAGDGSENPTDAQVEIVNSNEVRVRPGSLVNYEVNPTLNLNIRVTSNSTPTTSFIKVYGIDIQNIQEGGAIEAIASTAVEGFQEGTTLISGANIDPFRWDGGIFDPDGIKSNPIYTWYLNDTEVQSGTSRYYNVGALGGGYYRVTAAYIDGTGSNVTVSSNSQLISRVDNGSGIASANAGDGPLYTGVTLKAGSITGDPDGNGTIDGHQWYRNGAPITGATSGNHNTTSTGPGDYEVDIIYTDGQGYQTTVRSAVQQVTAPPDTTPPEIASVTLKDGTILLKFTEDVTALQTPLSAFTVDLIDPTTGAASRQTVTLLAEDSTDKTQLILLIGGGITDLNFRVSYTDLIGNQATGVIQDLAGNDLSSLTRDADNLLLTGVANISATGNAGNNTMVGNVGANSLTGANGNDTLSGGGGNDTLYGGNGNDTVSGGTGADLIIGGDGAGDDIYDGGDGIDSVRYTSATLDIIVNLANGAASGPEIGSDILSSIENVIGGQRNDTITGDAGSNSLDGFTGDDVIDGRGGNDTLIGGDGVDTAVFTNASTTYTFGWDGTTILITDASGTARLDSIENLKFSDRSGAISTYPQLNPNPVLKSITTVGNQILLQFSKAIDQINLPASARFTVRVAGVVQTISSLGPVSGSPNQLRLTLGVTPTSSQTVTLAYTDLTAGNDPTGVVQDIAGNDLATIPSPLNADTFTTITTAATLAANYTNLILSGTAAINGTGNALANTITGNTAVNVITGGAGIDTMNGGDAGDIYLIATNSDHGAAEIQDSGGAGIDELRFAATTATTPNNTLTVYATDTGLESVTIGTGTATAAVTTATTALNIDAAAAPNGLTITGNAGVNSIIGSAFGDTINGNAGNDNLSALGGDDVLNGGAGTDVMNGGNGSDLYLIASSADHTAAEVSETSASGTDELRFSSTTANQTLTVFAGDIGLEKVVIGTGNASNAVNTGSTALSLNASAATNALTLVGNNGANSLTGTAYDDTIIGNSGNDTVNGGLGNDVLSGGVGADIFRFASLLNATTNVDQITDFTPTTTTSSDRIQLENTGAGLFTALTATGTLAATAFISGAAFSTAAQRIRYESGTGKLFYDADGNGSGAAIQFATLAAGLTINNSQFVVT